MAAGKKKAAKEAKSIEQALWDTANKLRRSVESSEYKHVVLSPIFAKFASDKFERRRAELIAEGQEKLPAHPAMLGGVGPCAGAARRARLANATCADRPAPSAQASGASRASCTQAPAEVERVFGPAARACKNDVPRLRAKGQVRPMQPK